MNKTVSRVLIPETGAILVFGTGETPHPVVA
jgi:hypothetical protein